MMSFLFISNIQWDDARHLSAVMFYGLEIQNKVTDLGWKKNVAKDDRVDRVAQFCQSTSFIN